MEMLIISSQTQSLHFYYLSSLFNFFVSTEDEINKNLSCKSLKIVKKLRKIFRRIKKRENVLSTCISQDTMMTSLKLNKEIFEENEEISFEKFLLSFY